MVTLATVLVVSLIATFDEQAAVSTELGREPEQEPEPDDEKDHSRSTFYRRETTDTDTEQFPPSRDSEPTRRTRRRRTIEILEEHVEWYNKREREWR